MAEAFTALSDDANAIAYNPAGLAFIRRSEFTADYGRPIPGLEDRSSISEGFIGIVLPLRARKDLSQRVRRLREMDAVIEQAEKSSEPLDTAAFMRTYSFEKNLGTLEFGFSNLTLSGAATENVFALGYGRKVLPRLSAGVSLKGLYHTYTPDSFTGPDPVLSGKRSVFRISLDAGLLYNLYPRVFWGLAVADLNRPNLAVSGADKEKLMPSFRTGLSFRERAFKAGLDGGVIQGHSRILAGAEKWFARQTYALRAGGGIGLKDSQELSIGACARWGSVQLDYAFLHSLSSLSSPAGNHKFSFTYRFGKPTPEISEPGSLELYYSQLELQAEILKTRLEKSESDRKRLEKAAAEEAASRVREKIGALRAEGIKISTPMLAPEGMKVYVTERGDTLESLSDFFYGSSRFWPDLYNLNRERIGKAGRLKKGTVLLVPEKISAPELESAPLQAPAPPPPAPPKKRAPEPKRAQAPSTPQRPAFYAVKEGDTLQGIAGKVYGDSRRWKEIYKANSEKVERGWVNPGDVLIIP